VSHPRSQVDRGMPSRKSSRAAAGRVHAAAIIAV
jgi:hypothetical protein